MQNHVKNVAKLKHWAWLDTRNSTVVSLVSAVIGVWVRNEVIFAEHLISTMYIA